MEFLGTPGSAQERPGAPRNLPNVPRGAQERPGAPWSAQELPRASRSVPIFRSAQKRRVTIGNAQGSPGESDEGPDEIPAPRKRKVVLGVSVFLLLNLLLHWYRSPLSNKTIQKKSSANFVKPSRNFVFKFRKTIQEFRFLLSSDISSGGSSNFVGRLLEFRLEFRRGIHKISLGAF